MEGKRNSRLHEMYSRDFYRYVSMLFVFFSGPGDVSCGRDGEGRFRRRLKRGSKA